MADMVSVDDPGLTKRQAYVLSACYSDGHMAATVAEWLGVSPSAVSSMIRRAKATLVARGFPELKPYGCGGRAELRRVIPCLG